MPEPCATVVVPTLHAGSVLADCIRSLARQSRRDFEAVVVDNSGRGAARAAAEAWSGAGLPVKILDCPRNTGFGGAVNRGARGGRTPYVAVLNDDAVASGSWVDAMVRALDGRPGAGMAASRIVLAGSGLLDSAGLLLAGDASSKQRGHRRPPEEYAAAGEVLLPSGCAAFYRRAMLDEIGWFDEDFFLYVEDTDVGLRGRWAGWTGIYVPEAEVEHRYSATSGRASPLKAYYVERNRLFLLAKTFPLGMVLRAPGVTLARYWWHLVDGWRGAGAAARFREEGNSMGELAWIVLRAHAALLWHWPRLRRERRRIRATARLSAREFTLLARRFSITAREVAAQ